METYDFLVIGTGSGLQVANVAVDRGQSVAIVEKGPIGGTCLNRGCIPSKRLLYHADVLETVQHADEFEIHAKVHDVDFAEIVRKVNEDVHEDSESIRRGLRSSPDHDLYEGEAQFDDERTVEVVDGEDAGARLRAETVLVAAGTRPVVPPIRGIDDVDYITSTEALQLETPPDHLVIVGGGYIAAELAHFFGTFGSEVTIVGRRPNLLPEADTEVAAAFTETYADRFAVHTGHEATAVSRSNGEVRLEARPYEYADQGASDDGGGIVGGEEDAVSVTGDELLIAAGRRPNTDVLQVEEAGIETDDRGFVDTDEYLRASAEGVWALGDIVGEYLLKHNANHEARAVTRNLFGEELRPVDYTAMPWAVFGSPEVAGVGATEGDLEAADEPYATSEQAYQDTARGNAMHAAGFVKVIIDMDGAIQGCHIVGPDASSLIQEVVVAMTAGSGTVADVRESVHIHPALPEVVDRAFAGPFTRGSGDHQHHHD